MRRLYQTGGEAGGAGRTDWLKSKEGMMSYKSVAIVGGKTRTLETMRRAGFVIGFGVVIFTLILLTVIA